MSSHYQSLYTDAIAIDRLDTSRWGVESVFRDLRDGGVTAVNATIAIWDDFDSVIERIMAWRVWFKVHSDLIRPIRSARDIRGAKAEGRCGIIFGWQNATPIGGDLRRLALFHDLGVRIIQLTYNERNLLGNGCYELRDEGLSRFGHEAVREMNRLGILIDLSHTGDRSVMETIYASEDPVAFTHANARSQDDHPRNKSDEAIRALVSKGGVIGANAFPMFMPRGYSSTLDDYVDRIDYLVQMVGPDSVAIGTDFCQSQPREWFEWIFSSQGTIPSSELAVTPQPYRHLHGMEGTRQFGRLAESLGSRGYADTDISKIIGGNWLVSSERYGNRSSCMRS